MDGKGRDHADRPVARGGRALELSGQTIVTPNGTPGNTDEVVAANPVGKAGKDTEHAWRTADSAVLDVLGQPGPALEQAGRGRPR